VSESSPRRYATSSAASTTAVLVKRGTGRTIHAYESVLA
jgi:hypothetical protein